VAEWFAFFYSWLPIQNQFPSSTDECWFPPFEPLLSDHVDIGQPSKLQWLDSQFKLTKLQILFHKTSDPISRCCQQFFDQLASGTTCPEPPNTCWGF
jgi:hypothetical protein